MADNPAAVAAPTENISRSVLQFSVPSWCTFIINLSSAMIITRYLLPDAYGVLNTFQASSTLFVVVVCLGLDNGFLRYFVETPEGFDKHGLLFVSLLAPLVLLALLALALLPFWSEGIAQALFSTNDGALAALLFVSVAVNIVTRFITVFYRMDSNALLYGVFSVAIQLAMKGSIVVAALIRPDYETAVWASVIAVAVVVVAFVFTNRRLLFPSGMQYSFHSLGRLRGLLVYSLYTWPIPVLLYVHVVFTQIIIREVLGNESVGLFTSVAVFVGVVSAFQAGFATYWSGYMYRNYQTQVPRIVKMHDYLSLFVVVSMVLFVLFRDVAFLLLGSGYQATKPWFALLLVYPLLMILSETTAYGMGIARKSHLMVMVTLSSVVSNVVITWLLVPHWGLLGACAGSVVSGVLLFGGQTYFGQKYFRSIPNEWRTAFAVASMVCLSIGNLILTDRPASRAAFALLGLGVILVVYGKASKEILSLTRGALSQIR